MAADARIISEIAAIRSEGVVSEGVVQETCIRSLELGAGRPEEKLTNILASLVRIERQLEERAGGSLRP